MEEHTESDNYAFLIASCLAEVIMDEAIPEKLRNAKAEALLKLRSHLDKYSQAGYDLVLLGRIARKKGRFLMDAKSKAEIKKIMEPSEPVFNGVVLFTDPYLLPEEELICWSEVSLRTSLNKYGVKRYQELFALVFPKRSKEIFG